MRQRCPEHIPARKRNLLWDTRRRVYGLACFGQSQYRRGVHPDGSMPVIFPRSESASADHPCAACAS